MLTPFRAGMRFNDQEEMQESFQIGPGLEWGMRRSFRLPWRCGMWVYRWLSVTALALLLVTAGRGDARAGKPAAPAPARSASGEADDIRKVSEEWARLWSAKQLEPVVALYATDAV